MTRTRLPRVVKTIARWRPPSVRPRVKNRATARECFASGANTNGRLSKTCSASACLTWWFRQFLSELPASHSNPSRPARNSSRTPTGNVYYYSIQLSRKRRWAVCAVTVRHQPPPEAVTPYRNDVVVAAECMFTWSWLADVCAAEGITFVLRHARALKAIHGGKAKNDKIDSHKIAVLPARREAAAGLRLSGREVRRAARRRSRVGTSRQSHCPMWSRPDSFYPNDLPELCGAGPWNRGRRHLP